MIFAGVGGVCLFGKNGSFVVKNIGEANHISDNRPCKIPFESLEIYPDGDVYSCCNEFLKYKTPAGNIEKQSFDAIWNGKLYTDLRQRVLKGDYSKCNRDICTAYIPYSDEKEIPSDYKNGPKILKIGYDSECNYNCITCRDKIITNNPEKQAMYENVYLPKILEIAGSIDVLLLSVSGDPLFSRHLRHLMREVIKKNPKIKIVLYTNGFFLDEKNLTELGIQNNIQGVLVSVDTVNRETYKQILRTDAFDRVMKNIELMSEWRKQGKIKWITMNFVVHLMNYKEMPDFVKMAQKLDIMAFFSTYQPWISAEYHKRYDEVAVFEPKNKHYKELVEILHNPVFKDKEHCSMEQRLFDIVNS